MLICYMAFSQNDIQRFQSETDGTKHRIHFNNAGASLPPNIVRDGVIDFLKEEAELGGYEIHTKRANELVSVYPAIARMLNAKSNEIAIMENATAAWNAVFQAFDLKDGDEVITNQPDYASNYLAYLNHPADLKIKVIPNHKNGDPDLTAFEQMITPGTKLVNITHMPTNSGLIAPAEEIGEICEKHGLFYLLDACQTAGQYPLDVKRLKCHALSATGRKYMRGPRGTGFLFVSEKKLADLKPYTIDLHSATWTGPSTYEVRVDARKFENWEGNRANQYGLKLAVEYATEIGLDRIWERVLYLSALLRQQMAKVDGVLIHDIGSVKGGLVSFTKEGWKAQDLQNALFEKGVNVSWNGIPNTYLDMTERGLTAIVRASVHYYNTEEEVEAFVKILATL